jgi:hypothetical protein
MGDVTGGRFVHRGLSIYDRIEHQYEKIVAYLDAMKLNVEKLKELDIDDSTQNVITESVIKSLFEKETKKFKTTVVNLKEHTLKRLNHTRRDGDLGGDAFTRLNVLQENIIRFGRARVLVSILNKETNQAELKYVTKGANENKADGIKMNKLITDEYLKLVG